LLTDNQKNTMAFYNFSLEIKTQQSEQASHTSMLSDINSFHCSPE